MLMIYTHLAEKFIIKNSLYMIFHEKTRFSFQLSRNIAYLSMIPKSHKKTTCICTLLGCKALNMGFLGPFKMISLILNQANPVGGVRDHWTICSGADQEGIWWSLKDKFGQFSIKTYVVVLSDEAILMSTHNICFYEEITKIIPKLSSNTLLICSTASATEHGFLKSLNQSSYSRERPSNYCKTGKYSDTWKIAVITLKFEQCGSTIK